MHVQFLFCISIHVVQATKSVASNITGNIDIPDEWNNDNSTVNLNPTQNIECRSF